MTTLGIGTPENSVGLPSREKREAQGKYRTILETRSLEELMRKLEEYRASIQ